MAVRGRKAVSRSNGVQLSARRESKIRPMVADEVRGVSKAFETHDLIPPREALKILTWVSESGLYAGSRRTNELTKFPCGKNTLYSRQECEALKASIINAGDPPKRKFAKRPAE